jgi:hypothetical protein
MISSEMAGIGPSTLDGAVNELSANGERVRGEIVDLTDVVAISAAFERVAATAGGSTPSSPTPASPPGPVFSRCSAAGSSTARSKTFRMRFGIACWASTCTASLKLSRARCRILRRAEAAASWSLPPGRRPRPCPLSARLPRRQGRDGTSGPPARVRAGTRSGSTRSGLVHLRPHYDVRTAAHLRAKLIEPSHRQA